MEIKNASHWQTRDLRKLINVVLKFSGQNKPRIVEIKTGHSTDWHKGQYCGGRAAVNGSWIKMTVPKLFRKETTLGSDGRPQHNEIPVEFPVGDFSKTLIHEAGHNQGMRHDVMSNCRSMEIPESISKMHVRPKQEKPKVKRDLKQQRYEKAQQKVSVIESKLKRYEKLLKKWQNKVKYYENRNN